MMAVHIPAVLFTIGAVSVHTYGVIIAIAVAVAWLWADKRARGQHIDAALANDVFFWAVVSAFIGARLGFVIQETGYYSHHVGEIFAIWQGGLSFHGGVVGGVLGGYLVLQRAKQLKYFWQLADAVSAPLLLAAAIGRLGNWVNQELYGYPTHVPWAIFIDPAHRLPGYAQFATFHPTFAYELILNLIGVLLIVLVVERLGKPFHGKAFSFALGWYGLARGVTEIWRISARLLGPLSLAQLVSIFMLLIAGAIAYRQYFLTYPQARRE